jgi:hypothetical protein
MEEAAVPLTWLVTLPGGIHPPSLALHEPDNINSANTSQSMLYAAAAAAALSHLAMLRDVHKAVTQPQLLLRQTLALHSSSSSSSSSQCPT